MTDMDRIRANFAEWENVNIVQGVVPDILETIEFGAVAFLHITAMSASGMPSPVPPPRKVARSCVSRPVKVC